ncbi:hypothetical protein C2R22_24630 (plasmid) [Salinigranum rubrum]|uniref:Uncharacterized protein n=1 Tax=Salinigranum rubrum TaxID=755307 RepID=A0A2I8VS17_9EURY|nr:hypothetical protein [Salinigranum rubrum]AUV84718.1 hypothetical protein C2R22_24630 [Salinigranum rubrum]
MTGRPGRSSVSEEDVDEMVEAVRTLYARGETADLGGVPTRAVADEVEWSPKCVTHHLSADERVGSKIGVDNSYGSLTTWVPVETPEKESETDERLVADGGTWLCDECGEDYNDYVRAGNGLCVWCDAGTTPTLADGGFLGETLSVTVPDEWTERLGEDRIEANAGGQGQATDHGGFGGSFSTRHDGGQVDIGIGLARDAVGLDVRYMGDGWEVSGLAQLSPDQARAVARELVRTALVVEEWQTKEDTEVLLADGGEDLAAVDVEIVKPASTTTIRYVDRARAETLITSPDEVLSATANAVDRFAMPIDADQEVVATLHIDPSGSVNHVFFTQRYIENHPQWAHEANIENVLTIQETSPRADGGQKTRETLDEEHDCGTELVRVLPSDPDSTHAHPVVGCPDCEEIVREEEVVTDGGREEKYCRTCGWVTPVRGAHPEYGPTDVCPNCGPFGAGLFESREALVEYDHESARNLKQFDLVTDGGVTAADCPNCYTDDDSETGCPHLLAGDDCPNCGRELEKPRCGKVECPVCRFVVNGQHIYQELYDFELTFRQASRLLSLFGYDRRRRPGTRATSFDGSVTTKTSLAKTSTTYSRTFGASVSTTTSPNSSRTAAWTPARGRGSRRRSSSHPTPTTKTLTAVCGA